MQPKEAALDREISKKYEALKDYCRGVGSAVIAFSGGIDSSLVAYVAFKELGQDALAVTSSSDSLKRTDLDLTQQLTKEWGMPHEIIYTQEIDNPSYAANPTNRCYYCKTTLYQQLDEICNARGIQTILNGTNLDDFSDHRPGLIAAKEFRVRSPLVESGFHKSDIRQLAEFLNIKNAKKPQSACLSSRIPYGTSISSELLAQVERAENILGRMGFTQFRVRHHGDIARIEVLSEEFNLALENSSLLEQRIKDCGYRFVVLDLGGFRSGSLNDRLLR